MKKILICLFLLFSASLPAPAQAPSMTTIADTIYKADGSTFTGTITISWPLFKSADTKTVFGGMKTISVSSGTFSTTLVPNVGATPSGTSYAVTYTSSNGTIIRETWVVPSGGPFTIAAVRILGVPSPVLSVNPAQVFGNAVVETPNATQAIVAPAATGVPLVVKGKSGNSSNILELYDNSGSPALQSYFDSSAALHVSSLQMKTLEAVRFADQFAGADWCAKAAAADTDLSTGTGEVWINSNAGTSVCAASLSVTHTLRFIDTTVFTMAAASPEITTTKSILGTGATLKVPNGANPHESIRVPSTASGWKIEGMTFDGNRANNTGAIVGGSSFIWVGGDGAGTGQDTKGIITHNSFKGCIYRCITITEVAHVEVSHNRATDTGQTFYLADSSAVTARADDQLVLDNDIDFSNGVSVFTVTATLGSTAITSSAAFNTHWGTSGYPSLIQIAESTYGNYFIASCATTSACTLTLNFQGANGSYTADVGTGFGIQLWDVSNSRVSGNKIKGPNGASEGINIYGSNNVFSANIVSFPLPHTIGAEGIALGNAIDGSTSGSNNCDSNIFTGNTVTNPYSTGFLINPPVPTSGHCNSNSIVGNMVIDANAGSVIPGTSWDSGVFIGGANVHQTLVSDNTCISNRLSLTPARNGFNYCVGINSSASAATSTTVGLNKFLVADSTGTFGTYRDAGADTQAATFEKNGAYTVSGAYIDPTANSNGLVNIWSNSAAAINQGGSISLGGMTSNTSAPSLGFGTIKCAKQTAAIGDDNYGGYCAIVTTATNSAQTERMRIDDAGKVGIGTAGPGYRLDVQGGQINASGGLCIAADCKTSWPAGTGTVTSSGSPSSGDLSKFTSSTNVAPAVAANVYGLWSGTKDASHCLAGDATMQSCAGGGGSGTVTASGPPSIHQLPVWTTATDAKGLAVPASGTLLTGIAASDPAFSATPTLGVAASASGTLTFANATGSGIFTLGASPSTTTNALLGPAAVFATGHLMDVTVSSTTGTMHDSGIATANVPLLSAANAFTGLDSFSQSSATPYVATGTFNAVAQFKNLSTPATGVNSFLDFSGASAVDTFFGVVQNASGYGDVVFAGYAGAYAEWMRIKAGGVVQMPNLSASSLVQTDASKNLVSSNTLPSGLAATNMNLTTPALGAATGTSLVLTGIMDSTASINTTTAAACTLGVASTNCGSLNFSSGYTYNQEGTAGTAVTYTLPPTVKGKQQCVANSGTTGVVNVGILTVYPPASSYVIYSGTVNTIGGGGTHGVVSNGAAADAACFVAIDSTHWQVSEGKGTWSAN